MRSTPPCIIALHRSGKAGVGALSSGLLPGAERRAILYESMVSLLVTASVTFLLCVAPREFAYADLEPPIQNETPMSVVQLYDNDIWRLVHAARNYVLFNYKTGKEGAFSTDGKTIKMDWYFKSTDRPVILNGRALCIRSDAGIMKCMTVWSGPASVDCRYTLIEIKDNRQVCLRDSTP